MTPIDITPIDLKTVQQILREEVPDLEVRAFGSRVSWTARETSDLDLALMTEEPLDISNMARLKESFSESNLPFRVDIVDWADTSENFQEIIKRECIVVQKETKKKQIAENDRDEVTLGKIAKIFDAQRIPLSKSEREKRCGQYPYYGATGIMDYIDDFLFEGLHLLVAEDGSVEKSDGKPFVQLVDGKFWVNNHAHVLQCVTDEETKFLYYALSTISIRPYVSGSVQAKLSQRNLKKIPLPYPVARSNRHAIVHILGSLDDKIRLNQHISKTLEVMARALFKSWFVDFDPVRAKMEGRWRRGESFPGMPAHLHNLFPNRFVDSELGQIPKGWNITFLGKELAELISGVRPKGGSIETGIPSVGAENVIGLGQYDFSKEKYIPFDFFEKLKTKGADVRCGDVLLYKDGANIGRKTYFDRGFPHPQCAVNEHVLILRMQQPVVQRYLFFWLDQPWVTQRIASLNSNSAQPGINQTGVKGLPILIPTLDLISSFDKNISQLTNRLFANCIESQYLATIRDTLLPKLITGELQTADTSSRKEAGHLWYQKNQNKEDGKENP